MHVLSRIGRLQRASEEAILCARVAGSIVYYRDVAHALEEIIKKTPAEGAPYDAQFVLADMFAIDLYEGGYVASSNISLPQHTGAWKEMEILFEADLQRGYVIQCSAVSNMLCNSLNTFQPSTCLSNCLY